jgi:GMP synthase-like glutamine amidotransferase
MKIGILVTGHIDEPHKSNHVGYAHMFQQLFKKADVTFEYAVFNVIDDQWPETIDSCDSWLITGSASGVYDNTAWMQKLKRWITHAHEQGVPMVGICFGHQIIAEAFAGVVEKYSGGWSLGPQVYQLNNFELDGKIEIQLNAVHQDQVIEKPENARCIASSSFCENAILMYGDSILTIQAHPEFTCEYEKTLLEFHKGKNIALEPSQKALHKMNDQIISMDDLTIARWMARVLLQTQNPR